MKKVIIALVLFALIITFTGCSSSTSTSSGITFEELGYFKKPNDIGGYIRVKTIYVSNFRDDPQVWQEIESYGKREMWEKGGFTCVFFFNDRNYTPTDGVTLAKDFDEATKFSDIPGVEQYCVAGYWHHPNGEETFEKYPKGGVL